jgi:hypothetical protein
VTLRLTDARKRAHLSDREISLRARLRQFAQAYPRWSWRKAYWLLRNEGVVIDRKRVRRYSADEGFTRPTRTRKKTDRATATHRSSDARLAPLRRRPHRVR